MTTQNRQKSNAKKHTKNKHKHTQKLALLPFQIVYNKVYMSLTYWHDL